MLLACLQLVVATCSILAHLVCEGHPLNVQSNTYRLLDTVKHLAMHQSVLVFVDCWEARLAASCAPLRAPLNTPSAIGEQKYNIKRSEQKGSHDTRTKKQFIWAQPGSVTY